MSMQNPNKLHAACRVTGNPAAFVANRGFATVVRNSLGNWTLTYDTQLDLTVTIPQVQQILSAGFAAAIFNIFGEADASFQIGARDALGALIDVNFAVTITALSSRG